MSVDYKETHPNYDTIVSESFLNEILREGLPGDDFYEYEYENLTLNALREYRISGLRIFSINDTDEVYGVNYDDDPYAFSRFSDLTLSDIKPMRKQMVERYVTF